MLGSGVIALGLVGDEPQVFVTVSDDLVGQGIAAGDLVKDAVVAIDGRGGGRPEMAQGKGLVGRGSGKHWRPSAPPSAPAPPVRDEPRPVVPGPRVDGLLAPHLAARRRRLALTMHTALDIGTEFAKALVFEIDEEVTAPSAAWVATAGLSHMQSGTVADIAAVVDNCAVALQEAEEIGFRPTQVVVGIAGELVKGFTTTLTQERKKPDRP